MTEGPTYLDKDHTDFQKKEKGEMYLMALEEGKYDYREITSHVDFVFEPRYTSENPYINIIIGCCGRQNLVKTVLSHLRKAISRGPANAEIELTLCEMGDFGLMRKVAEDENVSYIFIPFDSADTENKHSEGLSHNLSYLLAPESEWYDFHCADTVVTSQWITRIFPYLQNDQTTFLQPFSERRLKYLNGQYTTQITSGSHGVSLELLEEKLLANEFENRSTFLLPESLSGAPGGSIFIRNKDFEEVGGYDPEIFWGWAPEDTMMWTKLEYLYNKENFDISTINYWQAGYCHLGKATYPSEDILLFHLDHAPSPRSKYMLSMKEVCDNFFKLDYSEKLEYFSAKHKVLLDDKNKLRDVRNAR